MCTFWKGCEVQDGMEGVEDRGRRRIGRVNKVRFHLEETDEEDWNFVLLRSAVEGTYAESRWSSTPKLGRSNVF